LFGDDQRHDDIAERRQRAKPAAQDLQLGTGMEQRIEWQSFENLGK